VVVEEVVLVRQEEVVEVAVVEVEELKMSEEVELIIFEILLRDLLFFNSNLKLTLY
jgi:hypothetical protein